MVVSPACFAETIGWTVLVSMTGPIDSMVLLVVLRYAPMGLQHMQPPTLMSRLKIAMKARRDGLSVLLRRYQAQLA